MSETERAVQPVTGQNQTLTPAVNATRTDAGARANIIALYRISPA